MKKNQRKTAQRSRSAPAGTRRAASSPARKKTEAKKPVQDVVYLAPKPFNRNRLILHLATMVAVVIALVLGLSVFFKVDHIYVSGCGKYTAYEISEASGIRRGDNLLTFSKEKAAARIMEEFQYVKSVRIGLKLPDTVNIEIVEVEVTYAIKAQDGTWWLISTNGDVMEQAEGNEDSFTKILGVQLENPKIGSRASAYQESQTQVDEDGNTIPVTVTAAQRLDTAVDIVGFLEANRIIGSIATVDVNSLGDIQIWYRDNQFQVKLGGTDQLSYKIQCMKSAVEQIGNSYPYETGVFDLSDPSRISYDTFS